MNYDPSGIASLLPFGGYPPGVLDRKLSEFNDLEELSLQNRHSKVVTAKIVFLKGLSV